MTQQSYRLADFQPGLVAIPAVDWMWTDSAIAFVNLTKGMPPGSLMYFGRDSASAAFNRNKLTELFLRDNELEWILYCDSDQTPPIAVIARLLSHNVDVVGALCTMRRPPYRPWVAVPEGTAFTGLLRVPWVGAGCLMVRRKVIEAMRYPWWEHPSPGEGEDVLFCRKAGALGFSVFVDCDLLVGHMTARAVDLRDTIEFEARPEGQEMLMRLEQREVQRNDAYCASGIDAALARLNQQS